MAKQKAPSLKDWFDNCGGWRPRHDLVELRRGIEAGMVNEQDEYGMTALSLAVMSDWKEGVEELLRAGADTELRYFRTGETVLIWRCNRGTSRSSPPWSQPGRTRTLRIIGE